MGTPASINVLSRPVILFDGVCNLCNSSVQFIISRDVEGKFLFASLQSPAAHQLLSQFDVDAKTIYSIMVIKDGKLYDQSDALIEIAKGLPGLWSSLTITKYLPKFFRNWIYRLVANNRYRIFGKQTSCMVPTPDLRSRFLN